MLFCQNSTAAVSLEARLAEPQGRLLRSLDALGLIATGDFQLCKPRLFGEFDEFFYFA